MKVLVLSNNEFVTKEITDSLEDLQKIVGGYIEIPFLSNKFYENGIDIIINEEGKFIDNMNQEIAIVDKRTNEVLDVVFGNCVFASHDEEGNTVELTEEQEKFVKNELRMEAVITYANKSAVVKVLFI